MTSLSRVKTSTTAVGCCGHRTASKRANPAIREILSLRQHPREFNICSPSPEATIALSRGPLCHYMKVAARRQHKSQFHFFIFRVQSSGFVGGNVATWRGLKIRRFQVCSFVCNEASNYLKIGNAAFAFSLFFWESSSLAENLATFRLPGFPISPAERIFLLFAANFYFHAPNPATLRLRRKKRRFNWLRNAVAVVAEQNCFQRNSVSFRRCWSKIYFVGSDCDVLTSKRPSTPSGGRDLRPLK